MYDIIIIGAGPAGLTSALYALRANKKVLVLESKCYGGQIVNAYEIENYPGIDKISGYDFANTLYNQVKSLGCEIKYERVIRITRDKELFTDKSNKYYAQAIIIATGVERRKLQLMDEDKFTGKGLSYCATCDGNFYKNKIVAVIGGGNTALEDALYLSNIGSKVYLIHRNNNFRGETRYIEKLKQKDNVEIMVNTTVIKIKGDEYIDSILIKCENMKKELKIDGMFIAIGYEPQNRDFLDCIEQDEYGYIKSNDGVHTNIQNIYVAGDTRVKDLRQLTTAISDGAIAATVAIKEIN